MRNLRTSISLFLFLGWGCSDSGPTEPPEDVSPDSVDANDAGDLDMDGDHDADVDVSVDSLEEDVVLPESVEVRVTLDGEPAPDSVVMQGGTGVHLITDETGTVFADVDSTVAGDMVFTASHPEARVSSAPILSNSEVIEIALTRFSTVDNPDYHFQDPGTPRLSPTTSQCGHCHITLNRDWYNSPHRTAAANRTVQDLFRGAAFEFDDAETCDDAGGVWLPSPGLGDGEARDRCFVGHGVVPSLNPGCDGPGCEAEETGACADCHAPGIEPEVGGNDLRDATGFAFTAGVHCDVCHRVERIEPDGEAGVGGRLVLLRPSEPRTGPLGPWEPTIFGPSHDSPNPRMGSVQRDHFRDATICSGCHQLDQPVLVPGASIDLERWPDGRLPIHSTWQEWQDGPLTEAAPCNACHMPPEPADLNAANLEDFQPLTEIGVQGGWIRAPGQVRHHSWVGPRTEESGMLQLAAAVFIESEVSEGVLTAHIRTKNVGPAHAIPTGEPLRSLLLQVSATCGEEALRALGGDIVPDYGGYAALRASEDGLDVWPDAEPGDRIIGIERTDEWIDYVGFGPFGDGRFTPSEKGIPRDRQAWMRVVSSVDADGTVELEPALSEEERERADFAYRLSAESELAGTAGFGFARVLTGPDGERMAPHFMAVDVVSDNRLLPQTDYTSEHLFETSCDEPVVRARLIHRPYPLATARERGWSVNDQVMTEVAR